MISPARALLIIAVISTVTILTRALPFLFFRKGNVPGAVLYLGKALPPAVMAMLVVYSLRGVSLLAYPYGLPELIAVAVTVALHLYKRNNLVSILGGTAVYMLCVQLFFC